MALILSVFFIVLSWHVTGLVDGNQVPLKISFQAEDSGQYICRIILRGGGGGKHSRGRTGKQIPVGDVRVFQICCMVAPLGNRATIDFVSPLSVPVVQNIPIVSLPPLNYRMWETAAKQFTPVVSGSVRILVLSFSFVNVRTFSVNIFAQLTHHWFRSFTCLISVRLLRMKTMNVWLGLAVACWS